MKINIFKIIGITIFFLFAIIGIVFMANVAHEYNHKIDLKGIAINNSICYLTNNIEGAYLFNYDENLYSQQYISSLEESSEKKSNFIFFTIMFLGLILLCLNIKWALKK